MKLGTSIALITMFSVGCGKRDQINQSPPNPAIENLSPAHPIVEINDSRIDVCAQVFHYQMAAVEQGGGIVIINGHKWDAAMGGVQSDRYDLLLDIDPLSIISPDILIEKLSVLDGGYVEVQLTPLSPAEPLFNILDALEDKKFLYWINPANESGATNQLRVYVPKAKK